LAAAAAKSKQHLKLPQDGEQQWCCCCNDHQLPQKPKLADALGALN